MVLFIKQLTMVLKWNILFLLFFLFALSTNVSGQINIDEIEHQFGKGETSLKKRIKISFVYNENAQTYYAKVSYRFDKLFLKDDILNSKGLIQVPFNKFQDLNLQKARYFKLDSIGNKTLIENVKVKYADVKDYFIKNIFYTDLKVKQFNCSVDLPKDYFVSYSYDIIYKDLKFLSSFYFQDAQEAVEDVKISIKKDKNIDFALFDFNLEQLEKNEDETYITYTGTNLQRYNSIANSVNNSYYLPHIIISVKSINTDNQVKMVLNSTDNLYNWYNTLIHSLSPNTTYINGLSKSIIGNTIKDEDKIDKIFKWVQSNIQYVAFENGIAGFKPTEAHEVAKLKYGDCKGMANLLVNLLRSEGFNAHHVWLGTRSNNYTYDIPSLVVDNHMICGLKFNDKTYYLDGTSKSATWYNPPAHIEGKEVMLANNETYKINTIKKSDPKDNVLAFIGVLDLNLPQPKITLNIELSGHFKQDFLSYLTYSSIKNKKNVPFYFIYDYINGIKVTHITKPVITADKITYTITGDYMKCAKNSKTTLVFPYLNIFEYKTISDNTPPLYIDYPKTIKTNIEVKNNGMYPQGNNQNLNIGGQAFSANYFTEQKGSTFYINQKLVFNLPHTSLSNQEEWNTFSDKIQAFNTYPLSYE